MAGIYVHIPFCVKKCLYCDFVSSAAGKELIDKYFEKLNKEIIVRSEGFSDVINTIYFGGGTPSSVDSEYITKTLSNILNHFTVAENPEITIEMNPGTVNEKKLEAYKKAGFNRLSMGLQSANDSELAGLGRIHTVKDFTDNYMLARKIGFNNINVDLMSAIPGQTVDSYKESLSYVISLKPEHISSYSLIIEEGTPFYNMYSDKEIIDEDSERLMYSLTKEILGEHGYNRYEISNYSLKGYESRHNSSYWQRIPYLGFGVAAASFVNNIRSTNTYDITKYINMEQPDYEEYIMLTKKEQMEEYVFLGLRMMKGINITDFNTKFGEDFRKIYSVPLKKMLDLKLLILDGDVLRLSENGIDVSNAVMAEFLF